MKRFSSKEGYEAFGDAVSTCGFLLRLPMDSDIILCTSVDRLREREVYIGVITNGDGRMRDVLKDLGFTEDLFGGERDLIVISEEEGVEKPDERIFKNALGRVNMKYGVGIRAEECLHVGDEVESDFEGAVGAGWRGLLVGRDVTEMSEVVDFVDRNNRIV
jgi:FMN phosphatase YigB (HAD superfamily)